MQEETGKLCRCVEISRLASQYYLWEGRQGTARDAYYNDFARGDSLSKRILIALLMVMLVMAAGCGGSDQSDSRSSQGAGQNIEQSETEDQAAAVDEDQALELVESELAASAPDDAN